MNKSVKFGALAISGFMLFAFTHINSDKSFEGVITYTMSADGNSSPQAAAMLQGGMKIYIKGDLFRSEGNFSMFKQISISNRKKPGEAIMLLDFMGNKYQIKFDDKEKKEAEQTKPEIKYLDGTKTIAGYACKEAQSITMDKLGNKHTTDIYYTDQLPYSNDGMDPMLKGVRAFLYFNGKRHERYNNCPICFKASRS